MKVLIISALAPPVNSPESIQAGRYISRLSDHELTLVTANVSNAWEPRDESLTHLTKAVTHRIERSMPPGILMRIWQKLPREGPFPDPYAPFYWRPTTLIKQLKAKPELIFSRSTPLSSHILAAACVDHFNCPWILHISDPLADNPFLRFSDSKRKNIEELEKRFFTQAALVTVTSVKTQHHYRAKYPGLRDKFRLLPNVFDEAEINPEPIAFDGPMKLTFTGRLYGSRNADDWVTAVEKAVAMDPGWARNVRVEFAGHLDSTSADRIRNSTAPNLHLLGPLESSSATMAQRDATLLISIDTLEDDARADMFFPSKLTDYLAARRRIIALTRKTSTTHEVVNGKFGWCFDRQNLDKLPALLLESAAAYARKDSTFFSYSSDSLEYSLATQAPRLLAMMKEVCP